MPGYKSQSVGQLGASYDMKFVKFFAQYMYTHNDIDPGSFHVNTGQGGVTVPLGVGTVMASYAYSRSNGGLDQTHKSWARRLRLSAVQAHGRLCRLPERQVHEHVERRYLRRRHSHEVLSDRRGERYSLAPGNAKRRPIELEGGVFVDSAAQAI